MSHLQVLCFDLHTHRFGLPVAVVREVVRAVAVSALPKGPPIVEGVVNVRGRVVAVLDIRQRFGLPRREIDPDQHFIIAQAGARLVALRVDRTTDVIAVEPGAVEPASHLAPGVRHVAGIAKLPDGLLVIHDLERFLSLDESQQLDAVLAQAERADELSSSRRARR